MKIVVDDKIPYIRDAVEAIADEVVYKKGTNISAEDVRDADALIVRTRTRCDRQLLEGSKVRMVATATIGYDHIDAAYMEEAGISWVNCPGCNAGSVRQYVESALLVLSEHLSLPLDSRITLGIVGCGHVGQKVREMAQSMGLSIMVSDPPKGIADGVTMADMAEKADIISFHVPLTITGEHATWHLANEKWFKSLKRQPIIINTSRGEVVDNDALLDAMQAGLVRQAVIDTWEHEPDINRQLLDKVIIGTPHIAGYSADGKVNADNMVMEAICNFFKLELPPIIVPPSLPEDFAYDGTSLSLYNPLEDSQRLKLHPEDFESLRGDYPLRREVIGSK